MDRRGIILIVCILSLFLTLAHFANSKVASAKIDLKVMDKVERGSEAEVTILLKDNANLNENINITYRAKSFNALSATLDKEEVEKISENPSVIEIKDRPKINLFLQDSTQLINATKTWSLQSNGINITGSGETVCIIDSGVNYSHPDLGGCLGAGCKVIGGYAFYNPVNASNPSNVMGDSDHGTHVAGIIAANGGIKGIAPDAKIVAIKACGPGAECDYNAILDGINWCVDNASIYNISVISLSLGTLNIYSSYCDSEDPIMTSAINSAIAKNISVIASTGNDGDNTAISLPACIENVTAVGAVDKSDNLIYNRNNITDLLAPGQNINSTRLNPNSCSDGFSCSGNYAIASGTSMAAPHVSAAFLLMRQFYKLQSNRKLSPIEIETALKNHGKNLTDTTGVNLTRINILSAIYSLDEIAPNVSLSSPANRTNQNLNVSFSCNASDLSIKNLSLVIWNYAGLNYSNYTSSSNLMENITLSSGLYSWNCLAYDNNKHFSYASSNRSFFAGDIALYLISPSNSNSTSQNQINFTCLSQSNYNSSLKNITFNFWNSTDSLIYNETKSITGLENSTVFNYTLEYENTYKWNCLSFNNQSNFSIGEENFTFTYSLGKPNVSLIEPADGQSYTSDSQSVLFYFNASGRFNMSCSLIINNVVSQTKNVTDNSTQSFTQTFTPETYSWGVNCTDSAGNENNSALRSFTISAPPTCTGCGCGGCGGGGGSSPIKPINKTANQTNVTTNSATSSGISGNSIQESPENPKNNQTAISGNIVSEAGSQVLWKEIKAYKFFIIIAVIIVIALLVSYKIKNGKKTKSKAKL